MGDVRLDDIDASGFEVRSTVLTGKEPFTELFKFKSNRIQVSESISLYFISLAPNNTSELGTHSDRDRSLLIKLLHLGYLARQERLFDEQRLMRFQRLGELFSQGLVYPSVEVAIGRTTQTGKRGVLHEHAGREGAHSPTSIPIDLTSLTRWIVASKAWGESNQPSYTHNTQAFQEEVSTPI